jgi:hypothetical protein
VCGQADIARLTAEVAALEKQVATVAASLVTVDQKVTALLGDLHREELAAQKVTHAHRLRSILYYFLHALPPSLRMALSAPKNPHLLALTVGAHAAERRRSFFWCVAGGGGS